MDYKHTGNKNQNPEEEDFYLENGLLVFTETYHLRRGYCCGSGCRHCPYQHENVNKKNKKDQ